MTAHNLFPARLISRIVLLAGLLAFSPFSWGALTDLADAPISGASSSDIKPNIVFIMDDSWSMNWDFLPDWAEEPDTANYLHRFANASYNGLAYNPGIVYVPPRYFDGSGALDAASYPAQNANETGDGTGGWKAVKPDGYGVQFVGALPVNLTTPNPESTVAFRSSAFYYTTVPGEYCADRTLKVCNAQAAPTADFPEPARLRWCKTESNATEAAPPAGACQAIRIDPTPGSDIVFTHARMPSPRIARLTFGSGTVTGITVDGKNILSGSASTAANIAANINKCTYKLVDACGIVGYKAKVNGSDIIVTAPGVPVTAMPSVTGGSVTAYAFDKPADNLAPGENLLTVITGTRASYPKALSRTDCEKSESACSHEEEMTNYANWYAYYRTRMQAMKTAASRSFELIDDKYRIGYFTINNNLGNDFQNVSDFDNTHKKEWYDMLFAAKPIGGAETPLRVALSNAGRLYAGKLSTLNNVTVVDPMQYYCQPAVTILSTDGYWNQGAGVQIDGSTAIGDQDGPTRTEPPNGDPVNRPQLDGGAGRLLQKNAQWKKTLTPTLHSWNQAKADQWQMQQLKWQKKKQDQPYYRTSDLQYRDKMHYKTPYVLEQRTRSEWWEYTSTAPTQSIWPLQQMSGTRQSRTWKLQKKMITKQTRHLEWQQGVRTKQTSRLQTWVTKVEQSDDYGVTWNEVDSCEQMFKGSAVRCRHKDREGPALVPDGGRCVVESRYEVETGNTDETKKTTFYTKVECGYTPFGPTPPTELAVGESCMNKAQSSGSPYTVTEAVLCDTNLKAESWQEKDSCTPHEATGIRCQYGPLKPATPVRDPGCVKKTQNGSFDLVEEVYCYNDWKDATEAYTPPLPLDSDIEYRYEPTTNWVSGACTGTNVPNTSFAPTVDTYTSVTVTACYTAWASSWSNVSSCTKKSGASDAIWTQCRYAETPSSTTNVGSCTAFEQDLTQDAGPYNGNKVTCGSRYTGERLGCSGSYHCEQRWTTWAPVDSCTPTTTIETTTTADSVMCRYRNLGEGAGSTAVCAATPFVKDGVNFGTPQTIVVGSTYGPRDPSTCRSLFTGNYANISNLGISATCVTSDNRQCLPYSAWSAWQSGTHASCPADITNTTASPYVAIAKSTASPFTVQQAVECVIEFGSPFDADEGCVAEGTVTPQGVCQKAVAQDYTDYTEFNSPDPNDKPAEETLRRFRTRSVNDYAPPIPYADPEKPGLGLTNDPCTEGVVDGRVTFCKNVVPLPWSGFASSCKSEEATASLIGVKTTCVNSYPETWSPVDKCTEQEASPANNYLWTYCITGEGDPTPDTLADVAQYYWATDLRDNCDDSDPICTNTSSTPRQFMSTYTLGMGISGVMQYRPDYETAAPDDPSDLTVTVGDFDSVARGVTADPANGICSWQERGACNWPKPVSDKQTAVDDLWHAAVNGRGTYFSASNPADVAAGISGALQRITAKSGSLAAPTFNSSQLDENTASYVVEFSAEVWTGDVQKYTVDASTKKLTTRLWSAKSRLDGRSTARDIFTFASGEPDNKKPFEWDVLSSIEKAYFLTPVLSQLCASGTICVPAAEQIHAVGKNLVNFLRGDRSNEGELSDVSKYYRQRASLLGDIVGSEAVYVQKAPWSYNDNGYGGEGKFKKSTESRTGMIYVGANDGMLHAFRDSDGHELWAYVPSFVIPKLYLLADKSYKHSFFVDGTPVMGDICTSDCAADGSNPVWKTILVGGLNHGGRGYYALDITDPERPKVLWEFSHENLGYSYGNPVITKLGGGKWVVLVASGYNNVTPGDGIGRLFVLDATTGIPLTGDGGIISTGAGDAGTPSGLAKITAWSNYPEFNNTAARVYGGDLLGNVWRFDINNDMGAPGYDAQRLATLKDANGKAQPITAAPELGLVKTHQVVFVGTGQLLGPKDTLATTDKQTIYAIKDTREAMGADGHGNPRANDEFVRQEISEATCSNNSKFCKPDDPILVIPNPPNPVDWAVDSGWFVDFPDDGERLNTNIRLVGGRLGFTTNTPKSGACVPAGSSRFYALNYETGGSLDEKDGLVAYDDSDNLSSGSNVIVDDERNPWFGVGEDCSGPECKKLEDTGELDKRSRARRVSWRQLFIE